MVEILKSKQQPSKHRLRKLNFLRTTFPLARLPTVSTCSTFLQFVPNHWNPKPQNTPFLENATSKPTYCTSNYNHLTVWWANLCAYVTPAALDISEIIGWQAKRAIRRCPGRTGGLSVKKSLLTSTCCWAARERGSNWGWQKKVPTCEAVLRPRTRWITCLTVTPNSVGGAFLSGPVGAGDVSSLFLNCIPALLAEWR